MPEIDLTGDGLGWIKLHRKIMDGEIWVNEILFQIFIYCCMRANHTKQWVTITVGKGKRQIMCPRGTFLFGRKAASEKMPHIPPSTIWYNMKRLEKMGMVNIKVDSQYSLVTVINYDVYQGEGEKVDSKVDSRLTAVEQPFDTSKNDKTEEKENKLKLYTPQFEEFWKLWKSIDHPGRSDKRRTSEKYRSLTLKGIQHQTILNELERYIDAEAPKLRERARRSGESKPTQFIPNCGKWLNRFNDWKSDGQEAARGKKDYADELLERGMISEEEWEVRKKATKAPKGMLERPGGAGGGF